jgi:hypothetical protein
LPAKICQSAYGSFEFLQIGVSPQTITNGAGCFGYAVKAVGSRGSLKLVRQFDYLNAIVLLKGIIDPFCPRGQLSAELIHEGGSLARIKYAALENSCRLMRGLRGVRRASSRHFSLPQVASQYVAQSLGGDRLGKIIVATCFQAFFPVADHGMSGQGHNGSLPAVLAEPSGGL